MNDVCVCYCTGEMSHAHRKSTHDSTVLLCSLASIKYWALLSGRNEKSHVSAIAQFIRVAHCMTTCRGGSQVKQVMECDIRHERIQNTGKNVTLILNGGALHYSASHTDLTNICVRSSSVLYIWSGSLEHFVV